jgi:diamine N-acetyltransferase
MTIALANHPSASIRILQKEDAPALLAYLQELSAESKSRFGPHAFDAATVHKICAHLPDDTQRYIAVDETTGKIIAYMLVKNGMLEWDRQRYAERGLQFDENTTVTYAPSVADEWQSSGLGSAMYTVIEAKLQSRNIQTVVLWGGVQASNKKAVGFYTKYGYRLIASFWHDGKDNHDMLKQLQ